VRAYPRESQEMVFDAHDRAFAFFRGACTRGIYDNMKTAVEAILVGRDRTYNRRFLQMCSHYLVEPVACTPASGWEKGQVENQVGVVRERFFSPRLRVANLDELSALLLDRCVAYARAHAMRQCRSKSRARRRLRLIHPMVRSTTQRIGSTTNRWLSQRRTISIFHVPVPEDAPAVLYGCPSLPAGTRTLAVETSWDLPSLGPGATANVDVTVPGARRGDFADASLDTSSIAFVLDWHVWSNNSVRVTARNVSASTVDLAAAPLAVQLVKRRLACI